MAFVSFVEEVICGYKNPEIDVSQFSLWAGLHNEIKDVMGVAFMRIVHDFGSHGDVQNLGLTPPNHGQTLGDKARASASYRVADP